MRNILNINTGWYFAKTAEVPDSVPDDWKEVTLPHTWNAEDGQDGGNDYYRGTCMYVREMKRPELESGGRAVLEFRGAAMTAEVFVNGVKLARHEGGYSLFRTDITDVLEENNLICVSVDNSENDFVYPQKADFTFYGGIYRDVNLITVSRQHFEMEKNGTPGIKVTPKVEGDKAFVAVETWSNGGENVRITVTGRKTELNEEASHGEVQASGYMEVKDGYACMDLVLESVRLWDGIRDPYLYGLTAELLTDGNVTDTIETRFGCRTFVFDREKGFLLNGRSYPLRGVSRHQDRPGVGNALTIDMHREDMEIIREIGANTIRLAHYQHAQEFYDLADEYGMVVWAEIPYITQHMPKGRENTLSQMRELITQCHHHPSIVCWGLSNEITASGSVTEDMLENHWILNDLCHRMDSTRPTVMAHVFMLETDSPIIDIPDIGSYNLYFGWYLGELEQNDSFFDEYHKTYPDRIIGFSEYGADANPKFQSEEPERGDYSEQFQAVYHEHLLKCIEERPYLWATHVWNMFDFAADGRDEGGACGLNQKGLVTFDRKIKKDAFYLYKAAWSRESFVHLCGRRYVDRTEEITEVKVYSNQPEVSLYVDGEHAETKRSEKVFVFQVPVRGEHVLEARAGDCADTIRVRRVREQNKEYLFQAAEIINWFDKKEQDASSFSILDTMGEIMANPEGAEILGKIMRQASASRGDVAASTQGNANLQKMMAGMTVLSLLKQAGDAVKPEQIKALNDALQQIKKSKTP